MGIVFIKSPKASTPEEQLIPQSLGMIAKYDMHKLLREHNAAEAFD
jgi:hypothetical protein